MKNWLAVVSLGVVAGSRCRRSPTMITVTTIDNACFARSWSGYNEVPRRCLRRRRGQFYAILNQEGHGVHVLADATRTFSVDVSQSHIHFGQHHTNGGISVWLCEGTDPAPRGDRRPAIVVAAARTPSRAASPGVDHRRRRGRPGGSRHRAAGEFAELLAAMRARRGLRERALGGRHPSARRRPNVGSPAARFAVRSTERAVADLQRRARASCAPRCAVELRRAGRHAAPCRRR